MYPSSELAREKVWGRIHLIPVLQAEEDRDQVRRHFADKAREQQLFGTETKVYNSDRYVKKELDLITHLYANSGEKDLYDQPSCTLHPMLPIKINFRRGEAIPTLMSQFCIKSAESRSKISISKL